VSKDEEVKPAEGAVKADPKEPTAKAPEPKENDPGDEAAPEGTDAADKPKKPNWAQRRIDELTREKHDARRERDYWRELASRGQQPQQAQAPQQQATATQKPQPNQYQTTEEYFEALADWKADQKWEARERQRREQAEKEAKQQGEQKIARTFAEREQKARDTYPDYDEVARGDGNPITELMVEAILRSEKGPDIAYFLGKNPDKALQIAQMTDSHSVALALGRIEAQIETAATPSQPVAVASAPKAAPTAAPPPPKVLSSSAPSQKRLDDSMSTAEWVKERNAQLRKKRA